jgi:hypothetical protein
MRNKFIVILFAVVVFMTAATSCVQADIPEVTPFEPQPIPTSTPNRTSESPSPIPEPAIELSPPPYSGFEEIAPLIADRITVADFVRDIKVTDIEYHLFLCEATAYTQLNIKTTTYAIASFYVEDYDFSSYLNSYDQNKYEILPDSILGLRVDRVLELHFEKMGIPYNLRGITPDSNADDIKAAFLNMNRDNDDDMYNIWDVVPNALIDESFRAIYIGGHDVYPVEHPHYNNDCFRYINYIHTESYEWSDYDYTIYNKRTVITFSIDDDGNNAGFSYRDVTHLN